MICQQCGQAVMLDMATDHLPPWCQRCGADIRDALYGKNAAVMPAAALTAAPEFDSRPLPVRERRTKSADQVGAGQGGGVSHPALFIGIGLFVAAAALFAMKILQ